MTIAFYAPMKPLDHPVPSGDRRMGKLIVDALELAGQKVEIASNLRAYDGLGNRSLQTDIQKKAWVEAENYVKKHKPSLWFTYHLYHKAPDWIGPMVAHKLKIPYVVAEASFAPKQAGGKWDLNHKSVESALRQCQKVYQLNPADEVCVKSIISNTSGPVNLPPFLKIDDFNPLHFEKDTLRKTLADKFGMDTTKPWLVVAAMMRDGDKLKSYEILSKSLLKLNKSEFNLLVCGTGDKQDEVYEFLTGFDNTYYLGLQNQGNLREILFASDMLVWPGINEAFGLAMLEAQAAGLPVVAGNNAGIANIIRDGETGILTKMGNPTDFADAIQQLLDNPLKAQAMGKLAAANVKAHHDIRTAADIFTRTLPL